MRIADLPRVHRDPAVKLSSAITGQYIEAGVRHVMCIHLTRLTFLHSLPSSLLSLSSLGAFSSHTSEHAKELAHITMAAFSDVFV